jgi:hypothetical protein
MEGKTLALDSARLYRVKTVLAELQANTEVSFLNPVEIRSGDRRLGWASLSIQGGPSRVRRLIADLVFSYATPERLSIETGAELLYARIEAVTELGAEPWEVVGLYHSLLPEPLEVQVLGIEIQNRPGFYNQPSLCEAVL